jgi:DNA-binding PadR family transcriptional regulator
MLTPLEQAILVVVDRLTRDTHTETDSDSIRPELGAMGLVVPNELLLGRVFMRLRDEGYLTVYVTGGGRAVMVELTHRGREQARANPEPVEQIMTENRRLIASGRFAEVFPNVFEPWADAEILLFADDAEAQLTTVGHKIREAAQAFATAMIQRFGADEPPADVKLVKKRLGAVIAHNRSMIGDKQRRLLESLGDLWETTVDLIERQEHAAQKEGEPVSWNDGRRIVTLTMFLMIEFDTILEDREVPPPATLEPG